MRRMIFTLIQCTWGILQTLAGLVVFMIFLRCKHFYYHGIIVTEWTSDAGLSLGLFTFVQKRRGEYDSYQDKTIVHEYGHSVQSAILGPLYLLVIGIPSLVWCSIPALDRMRERKNRSYYDFYTESMANKLGKKITGQDTFCELKEIFTVIQ